MKRNLLLVLCSVFLVAILLTGCGGNKVEPVKKGDTVKVDYTGKLDDGTQFDSSKGRQPLQFVVGAGSMIQGFDEAVVGMKVGDTKTIKIPPEKAYGTVRPDLVFKVSPDQFPEGTKPKVGEQYQAGNGAQVMTVRVVEVTDKEVTLDANHQLAGKTLTFDITMVEVKAAK
jgi:peptidylprolyl isomerase